MSLGDWCLHMLQKPYISLQHLITSEYHEEIHQWQQKLGGCITNPRQILWHINQDTDQIPHCPCGNTVSWQPMGLIKYGTVDNWCSHIQE